MKRTELGALNSQKISRKYLRTTQQLYLQISLSTHPTLPRSFQIQDTTGWGWLFQNKEPGNEIEYFTSYERIRDSERPQWSVKKFKLPKCRIHLLIHCTTICWTLVAAKLCGKLSRESTTHNPAVSCCCHVGCFDTSRSSRLWWFHHLKRAQR